MSGAPLCLCTVEKAGGEGKEYRALSLLVLSSPVSAKSNRPRNYTWKIFSSQKLMPTRERFEISR